MAKPSKKEVKQLDKSAKAQAEMVHKFVESTGRIGVETVRINKCPQGH